MADTFREKLRNSRFPVGTLVTLGALEVSELLSGCGYDWLLFDMEHSALSLETTQRLILASRPQCATFVRIPENAVVWIKKTLDTGCDGIVVPMVNSREEAEQAVRAAKYPPEGARSVGISRAHGYGSEFRGYVDSANESTTVIIQMEHAAAVEQADEIVSAPGIDAVMIGPYDLSASMNLMGQIDHVDVQAAIVRIQQACKDAGVPVGIFAMSPDRAAKLPAQGFQFAAVGIDTVTLQLAATAAVKTARDK